MYASGMVDRGWSSGFKPGVFGVDLPTACVAHVNPLNFSVQTNLLVNQPLILHPKFSSALC